VCYVAGILQVYHDVHTAELARRAVGAGADGLNLLNSSMGGNETQKEKKTKSDFNAYISSIVFGQDKLVPTKQQHFFMRFRP